MKLRQRFSRKHFYYVLFLIVVLGGIVFSAIVFRQNTTPDSVVQKKDSITFSTDTPSEVKPGEDYTWTGERNDPKKIAIESIGVDGFLQNVGVDQNNQIAVPDNIHIGGWFVDSVRPGSTGLSIIDGHVNGITSDEAIFTKLPAVEEGDEVTVTFGDNTKMYFKVIQKQQVKTAETASVLFSQIPNVQQQLNLITCVGEYDSASKTYDQRFVVSAERINR